MEISCQEQQGTYTLFLNGRLDSSGAGELNLMLENITPAIESKLVLDYARVPYIGSSGLRVIVKLAKRLQSAGKELELVNVNSDVYKIFKMTGFTGIMNISRIV